MTPLSGAETGARTVFVTGAAGAGVSSVAGAMALAAARSGHKTLLTGVDGAGLSEALRTPLAAEPTELEPGLYGMPLGTAAWQQRVWQVIRPAVATLAAEAGLDQAVIGELAGSSLVSSVLRLAQLRVCLEEGRWDLVIVDLGPTDAAFELLRSAERVRDLIDRALPVQRRVERAVRAGAAVEPDPTLTRLPNVGAHLQDLAALVEGTDATSVVVTSPDARGARLGRDAVAALSLLGQDVAAVLVNRMAPSGRGRWQAGLAAAQAEVLAGLVTDYRAGCDGEPRVVRGLPELTGAALASVPDELASGLVDLDLLQARPTRGVQVIRADGGYELQLTLPGLRADQVDLRRRGDDLLITLGATVEPAAAGQHATTAQELPTRARVLRLPSALRRCDVVGARLRAGRFVVYFRPNPKLWNSGDGDGDRRA